MNRGTELGLVESRIFTVEQRSPVALRERVVEEAVVFGNHSSLVGILTGADSAVENERLGVIWLNAGMLHRIGPHRLYVDLARDMALDGIASLRFDFSGVGDSEPRRDGLPAWNRIVPEVLEAMELLEARCGVKAFVIGGLCAGADAAYRVACASERVVGVVMMDGFPYRTPGFYLRHYGRRLFNSRSWRNVITGRHPVWNRIRSMLGQKDAMRSAPNLTDRDIPPKNEAIAGVRALLRRGARFLCLYTGGLENYYNSRGQLREAFRSIRFDDSIRVEYLPETDHTFTLRAHHEVAVALIREWVIGCRSQLHEPVRWGNRGPHDQERRVQKTTPRDN